MAEVSSGKTELTERRRSCIKNAKGKGSRNELKSKLFLESTGALVVKAGASLGAADLIAIWLDSDWEEIIQVKSNRLPAKDEKAQLIAIARRIIGQKRVVKIHRWRDYKPVQIFLVRPTGEYVCEE